MSNYSPNNRLGGSAAGWQAGRRGGHLSVWLRENASPFELVGGVPNTSLNNVLADRWTGGISDRLTGGTGDGLAGT